MYLYIYIYIYIEIYSFIRHRALRDGVCGSSCPLAPVPVLVLVPVLVHVPGTCTRPSPCPVPVGVWFRGSDNPPVGMARPWHPTPKPSKILLFFACFFPCFFESIFGPFCLPTCLPKTIKIDEKSMPRCIPTWIPFLQSRPRGVPHRTVRWGTLWGPPALQPEHEF